MNMISKLIKRTEKSMKNETPPSKFKKFMKKKLVKRILKLSIFFIIIIVAANIILSRFSAAAKDQEEETFTTSLVERRDISTVLSSSGSITPLNTYNITTLVKGEIIAADFEVGDWVKEGDVLYQLTTDEVDSQIEIAQTTLNRAQEAYDKTLKSQSKSKVKLEEAKISYQEALADYDEVLAEYNAAAAKYANLSIIAEDTGNITTVYVEEGATIQKGSKIADLYNDSIMKLEIPFNADEVGDNWVGKTAQVEVAGSFETLEGTVIAVSDSSKVLSGNQIVRMITIEVRNLGGITTATSATAMIGNVSCNSTGTFTVGLEKTITASMSGDIKTLSIATGQSIKSGEVIFELNADTVEDQLTNYSNSLSNAEKTLESAKNTMESAQESVEDALDNVDNALESIEDAQTALDDTIDSLTDCEITSPITGQVISKDMLVGDIIGTSNFSSILAVIYDLSAVTFEMEIDELDIMSVKEGQTVNITADALEGTDIVGTVTNVSLESTTSGGVTQYPVTVQVDDVGSLLPGMNVTGEIVIEGVENVLSVPVDALRRGDVVYVKDDTVLEVVGEVPVGFRSVEVETGLSDEDYIEIVSGLSETDEVYVTRYSSGTGMDAFSFGGLSRVNGAPSGMENGTMTRPDGSGNAGGMPGRPGE